jgi:TniQ
MNRSPWFLRVGLRSFTRSRPWLQYCPHCLQADGDPYFRQCWRLAVVTICPQHHRRLLDRCGNCDAVINFHCLPGDADTMTQCHSCRYDLRFTRAPTLDASPEYHRLLQFQTFLLKTMQSGRCRLWSFHSVQSARFFEVLHKRVCPAAHIRINIVYLYRCIRGIFCPNRQNGALKRIETGGRGGVYEP